MISPFVHGPAILFCPADRPERYGKALERADAVIIDLEDAVPHTEKDAARRLVRRFLERYRERNKLIYVRINALDTVLSLIHI